MSQVVDIVYPPLGHETALEVEVGEERVNTSLMAMLEVEAHPLPYFSDIVWTIAREGEEKQVGGTVNTASSSLMWDAKVEFICSLHARPIANLRRQYQ